MPRGHHARPLLPPAAARVALVCTATTAGSAGLLATATAARADTISPSQGATAVSYAAQEAGHPYQYGATGPNAFDCSGLVQYVYARLGVPLPRTASAQYAAMAHIASSAARPGDVVFFYDANGGIYHDAIYAGNGQMWAAPHTGDVVRLQPVYGTSWEVARPSPGAAPSPTSAPSLLKVGSSGAAVAQVQRAVGVPADGAFGPLTAAAVRSFQAVHGLAVDGVVGPLTLELLLQTGSAAPAAPAPAPAVQPASTAVSAGHPLLRYGDTGAAVVALQRALGVAADGQFGPVTRGAVVALQARNGLVQDGVVGPLTWGALGQRV